MQNATGLGGAGESGESVQRDPDGTRVVAACDRCPDAVYARGLESLDVAGWERAKRYSTLTIGSVVSQPKTLRLCPDCTRKFRLFMLCATERDAIENVGERWESVVSGAV